MSKIVCRYFWICALFYPTCFVLVQISVEANTPPGVELSWPPATGKIETFLPFLCGFVKKIIKLGRRQAKFGLPTAARLLTLLDTDPTCFAHTQIHLHTLD